MTWAEVVVGAVTPWYGARNPHLYEMVAEVLGVARLSRNQRAKVRQTCQRLATDGIVVAHGGRGWCLSRAYSKVPACCGGVGACDGCVRRVAAARLKRVRDEERRLAGRCERCLDPVVLGNRCGWHVVENRERCARWHARQRAS